MYARVVTVQAQPGKGDEAIAIFRDSVIPAAKQQNGHQQQGRIGGAGAVLNSAA